MGRKYGPLDTPSDVIRINEQIRQSIPDMKSRKGVRRRLRESGNLIAILSTKKNLRRLGTKARGQMVGIGRQQFTQTVNSGNAHLKEIGQLNNDPFDNVWGDGSRESIEIDPELSTKHNISPDGETGMQVQGNAGKVLRVFDYKDTKEENWKAALTWAKGNGKKLKADKPVEEPAEE